MHARQQNEIGQYRQGPAESRDGPGGDIVRATRAETDGVATASWRHGVTVRQRAGPRPLARSEIIVYQTIAFRSPLC